MDVLGLLGIVLALATIILLIVRGYSASFASIVASMVVIIFNGMPLIESLVGQENSFVAEFGQFIINNFLIFILGSLLASYMENSGATLSIAKKILSIFGKDNQFVVMLAIFVLTAILTYGGISMFVVVFAVIPLARPLFEELDIPWRLVILPLFAGLGTFTMTMLPGTPSMPNIIASNSLGTALTALPWPSVLASLAAALFAVAFIWIELKRSQNRGEGYQAPANLPAQSFKLKETIPAFWKSILPILFLISLILLFSQEENIVVAALMLSVILAAILFQPYLPSQKETINQGINSSFNSIMNTGTTVAFGGMLTQAPAFKGIIGHLLAIPGNPLFSLIISTGLISLVTGSATATTGIVAENFAHIYLDLGIDPQIIHRVTTVSAGIFGNMPHTGLVITVNELTGLKFKDTMFYAFFMLFGAHLIGLAVILICLSL